MNNAITNQPSTNYFERNRLWLTPLIVGVMLLSTPLVASVLDIRLLLPVWVAYVGAVLAAAAVGYGAMTTKTTSARLVVKVGSVMVVAFIVLALFNLVR